MNDLTGFQRDALLAVASLSDPKGLDVKRWLEEKAGWTGINHGRLYPNLDALADKGLIRKERDVPDGRSNQYVLLDRGRRDILAYKGLVEMATAREGRDGSQGLAALGLNVDHEPDDEPTGWEDLGDRKPTVVDDGGE